MSTLTPRLSRFKRRFKVRQLFSNFWVSLLTWALAALFFFPVYWMILTGFKTEADAGSTPPLFVFQPTLENFANIFERGVWPFALNSIIASVVSTVAVIILAIPAAYALAIRPIFKWQDGLFFFLSTKMLPPAASIAAVYWIVQNLGVLNNIWTLVVFYTAMNLPIATWMIRSFMIEIPAEVLEAAKMDGAGFLRSLSSIIFPMLTAGLSSAALICFIFSWNEFFLALNLSGTDAGTLPVFLTGFVTAIGQYWASLCAATTFCAIPVIIAGWTAQKQLVRGLSLGAVK